MSTVVRLNVTPVKSTALHNPERIMLERHGAVGNREFFFIGDDGRRFSGSRKMSLITIRAEYDATRDHLTLRLPDGIVVSGPVAANGEALTVDFYGRPVPARVIEGDWEEALSRYAGHVVRLARVDRPGEAIDVKPVTLVSLASVAELSRRGGRDQPVDTRRFRMLVEIDGCAPHEEDAWAGRRVRIGDAEIRVGDPVPRCVITTLDPETGLRDFPTLSVIRSYRGVSKDKELEFGVYGEVVRPGTIGVGDPVEPLD
ncbi:MAG TPA: MOSC domain-containing protein [Actinomycetota bacterium]|nr:MOSC domain-containing protein [Actinomycetota bacterium]